ncbi:MAG TPA: HAD-IIIA family hydrolase [Steroidobacteraceae bacterium]|jgi:D-glycero-D-manno-heptose 1,7-bisphosphate phosphatase|nr:HAD-IIIA family hydrolase [Steroidobacteraceae bacterium]
MAVTPLLPTGLRHLILDRDGVLNEEAADDGYIRRAADFKWLPGALGALAAFSRAGLRISIATNQSAVGRGLMSAQDLDQILAAMLAQAEAAGASISGVYFCPHAPAAHCDCRKPAPGLIRCAVQDSGLAAALTLVVGDDVRDVDAARAAGVAAALVRTGKGRRAAAQLQERGDSVPVFDDLAQLAERLNSCSETHCTEFSGPAIP